jgi:hypothetical protein
VALRLNHQELHFSIDQVCFSPDEPLFSFGEYAYVLRGVTLKRLEIPYDYGRGDLAVKTYVATLSNGHCIFLEELPDARGTYVCYTSIPIKWFDEVIHQNAYVVERDINSLPEGVEFRRVSNAEKKPQGDKNYSRLIDDERYDWIDDLERYYKGKLPKSLPPHKFR